MTRALLISEDYIKNNTTISENVNWKLLQPIVFMCQDIHVEAILGSKLYQDLMLQINADPTLSANPNYKTLLTDYVLPTLHYYIMKESVYAFKFRFMNKGVMIKNSEYGQPGDTGDLKLLIDNYRNISEAYAERATKYLMYNTGLYPLYFKNINNDIQPNRKNYSTGIDLGDYGKYDNEDRRTNFGRQQFS